MVYEASEMGVKDPITTQECKKHTAPNYYAI